MTSEGLRAQKSIPLPQLGALGSTVVAISRLYILADVGWHLQAAAGYRQNKTRGYVRPARMKDPPG